MRSSLFSQSQFHCSLAPPRTLPLVSFAHSACHAAVCRRLFAAEFKGRRAAPAPSTTNCMRICITAVLKCNMAYITYRTRNAYWPTIFCHGVSVHLTLAPSSNAQMAERIDLHIGTGVGLGLKLIGGVGSPLPGARKLSQGDSGFSYDRERERERVCVCFG